MKRQIAQNLKNDFNLMTRTTDPRDSTCLYNEGRSDLPCTDMRNCLCAVAGGKIPCLRASVRAC